MDIPTAVVSLAGSVIVGIITLGGVFISQLRQAERDRAADERNLRNAKRLRLHAAYTAILSAALKAREIADREPMKIPSGESWDARRNRMNDVVWDFLRRSDQLKVTVSLEEEAADIETAFGKIQLALSELRDHFEQNVLAGAQRDQSRQTFPILDDWREITSGINELTTLAREHLARLDRPI